jgi:hypothetical protein
MPKLGPVRDPSNPQTSLGSVFGRHYGCLAAAIRHFRGYRNHAERRLTLPIQLLEGRGYQKIVQCKIFLEVMVRCDYTESYSSLSGANTMFPQFQFPNFSGFSGFPSFPNVTAFPGMQPQGFDFSKFADPTAAMSAWSDLGRNWQAVATEMTEYSKRAMKDGTATMEQLMAAKSVEQAFEIQTSYAKRSYEEYVQEMTRLGNLAMTFSKR